MIFGFVISMAELGLRSNKEYEDPGILEFSSFYTCVLLWIMVVHSISYIINDFVLFLFTFVVDFMMVVHKKGAIEEEKDHY
jgi:hypothetical protein